MNPFAQKEHTNEDIASLTIGCDLKVTDCNQAWRTANLPGSIGGIRQRVDSLFPGSEVGACVLDVLYSAKPRENVVIGLGGKDRGRYLWANFHPLPAGAKPRSVTKVLMQAWETNTRLLVDRVTAPVLEGAKAEEPAVAEVPSETNEERGWRSMPAMTEAEFEKALAAAERKGTHYLGRVQHRGSDGREIELETLLLYLDAPKC